jgi:hypothetical protein
VIRVTVAEMCRRKAALAVAVEQVRETEARMEACEVLAAIDAKWEPRLDRAIRGWQIALDRADEAQRLVEEAVLATPIQQM